MICVPMKAAWWWCLNNGQWWNSTARSCGAREPDPVGGGTMVFVRWIWVVGCKWPIEGADSG